MSKQRAVDLVNVFWGSEIFKKQSDGKLSSKWYFFKPQIGNLSPACHLPNAAFCVVPYSGSYSTGYGIYNPSYGSVPTEMSKEKFLKGFTHFCHSGSGFIENFYNYFMICPSIDKQKILSERGGCGWYEADTPDYCAKVALDGVTANYEFALKKGKTIRILPYYGGLDNQSKRCKQYHYNYTEERRGEVLAFCVNIDDMPLYFAVASKNKYILEKENGRYHLTFDTENASLSVSYSFVSADEACARVTSSCFNYTEAKKRGEDLWQKTLSVVDIKGDEKTRILFYTALYNALKKPCIDNFAYPVFDLATMWDLYKTHFPLMYIFYPTKAATIVDGLAKCFANGHFYNSKLMEMRLRESKQAVSLMSLCIATAYLYGIDADYDTLLPLAKKDLEYHAKRGKIFKPYVTHNLDFLDAYYALIACGVDLSEDIHAAAKFRETRLYNKKELLKRGIGRKFYEGTNVNYSFRVSSSMEPRLKKSNKHQLIKELDRFFGFDGDDVTNFTSPTPYRVVCKYGKRYRRFEGLNNETDMETMYMYHKLHEYGKCEDIINEAITHHFNISNGGLCGNDDSGGLTSWLVLNILGLYPVIGTNELLIGSPQVDEATIMLDNKLTIKVVGHRAKKHISRVLLNGKELINRQTDIMTLRRGGELVIEY
ncbi:MAG: glycoside hydrolase family 92 protein [Clostridia bacterium]|nr:glycoside hydrolase family 92 protein [Clostridia bacterium]